MSKRRKIINKLITYVKLNKRPILKELQIFTYLVLTVIVILQFIHINGLQKQYDYLHMDYSDLSTQIEQVITDYDTLMDENAKLKELNLYYKKDIDSLEEFITEIEKKLDVAKGKNNSSPQLTSRGGGDENKGKWMNFQMTHYQPFCEGCNGITYTEVDVTNSIYHNEMRVIAVDPNVIPLGATVEIKRSNGETFLATAQDVGGAIKGNIVDLLVKDRNTALEKGRQSIQLRIIN